MKITKTRLKEIILEVLQEDVGQTRTNDEIYQELVDELNKVKDDPGARELMLSTLDALKSNEQISEGSSHQMMGGIDADDHEVEMALSDLHKLEEYAPQVAQLASQYSNLPGWVQSKITLAADYLGKVYHYLDGKQQQGME